MALDFREPALRRLLGTARQSLKLGNGHRFPAVRQPAEPGFDGERDLHIGQRVALEALEAVARGDRAGIEGGTEVLQQVALVGRDRAGGGLRRHRQRAVVDLAGGQSRQRRVALHVDVALRQSCLLRGNPGHVVKCGLRVDGDRLVGAGDGADDGP